MALTFGAAGTDRVELAAGLDNLNAFTVLMWHYPTTVTAARRFWHKGIGDAKSVLWGFGANVGPSLSVTRATTNLFVESNKSYATSKWWYNAFTFDTTDGGRVFSGDLTNTVAEDSYGSRNNGAGAVNDDSGDFWVIGNNGSALYNQVYQGRIAVFAHFRRRMSLQEIIRWQFMPYADADCDIFMQLGYNGTGTQPNLTSLGNGINGTVTGATVGDHVPLSLARSDPWMPPFVGPVALGLAVSGVGTVAPALTAQEALSAAIVGQGSLSAGISLIEALNLAAAGLGTLTADLTTSAIKELATAIAGQAAMGTDLVITRALEAVISGTAQIAPALNSQVALNAVIAGGGTLVATLTIQGQEVAVVLQDGVFSLYSYNY